MFLLLLAEQTTCCHAMLWPSFLLKRVSLCCSLSVWSLQYPSREKQDWNLESRTVLAQGPAAESMGREVPGKEAHSNRTLRVYFFAKKNKFYEICMMQARTQIKLSKHCVHLLHLWCFFVCVPADSSSYRLDWLLTAACSESVSVLVLLIPAFNRSVCLFILYFFL